MTVVVIPMMMVEVNGCTVKYTKGGEGSKVGRREEGEGVERRKKKREGEVRGGP